RSRSARGEHVEIAVLASEDDAAVADRGGGGDRRAERRLERPRLSARERDDVERAVQPSVDRLVLEEDRRGDRGESAQALRLRFAGKVGAELRALFGSDAIDVLSPGARR